VPIASFGFKANQNKLVITNIYVKMPSRTHTHTRCTHERLIMQPTSKQLSGPLRSRINRLAHAHALQHETRLKASLLEQVQAARDGGASFDELAALVGKLEAAPC
jgi:predicted ATPase with chaperone activity